MMVARPPPGLLVVPNNQCFIFKNYLEITKTELALGLVLQVYPPALGHVSIEHETGKSLGGGCATR